MSSQAPEEEASITLVEGQVVYGRSNGVLWQVSVEQLAVIGEYTDPNGPSIDDYFLVFITKNAERFTASFYSDGRDMLLSELGRIMGSEVVCALCNSTDYLSRVMWPHSLRDKKLFEFVPIRRNTLWGRIVQRVFPTYEMNFTNAVNEHLQLMRRPV